jgi:hypothetical protein
MKFTHLSSSPFTTRRRREHTDQKANVLGKVLDNVPTMKNREWTEVRDFGDPMTMWRIKLRAQKDENFTGGVQHEF